MKPFLIVFSFVFLLAPGFRTGLFAEAEPAAGKEFSRQQPPPPPPGKFRGKRRPGGPGFMTEMLENSGFSQEEKERIRRLMEQNPREAKKAMFQLFMAHRKAWEKEILRLRQNCLDAKTDAEKKAAADALKQALRKDADRRLESNRRMLESMEKNIARMQDDLKRMKKQYEARVAERDAFLEKQYAEILKKGLPEPPRREPPQK